MIQRLIYTSLTEGIASALQNNSILEDLFLDNFELSKPEVELIITAFNDEPPNVIHGYARSNSVFPLYSIVLGNEGEDKEYMGDDAGQIEDEDDEEFGADCFSAIWKHDYQIMVVTEHPDMTIYFYELAKSLLLAFPFGQRGDLFEIKISGGDMAPDPRYMPEHLFVRQIKFGCNREFLRTDLATLRQKAFTVSGIHVDSSGSPSDVGDVKTLITTYGVDDGT